VEIKRILCGDWCLAANYGDLEVLNSEPRNRATISSALFFQLPQNGGRPALRVASSLRVFHGLWGDRLTI
jgi:hypothetical protein